MPKYKSTVDALTHKLADVRDIGLESLESLLEDLPKEKRILVLQEPGFLAAMEAFLTPAALEKTETAKLALRLLHKLVNEDKYDSDIGKECAKELFESPCFAAVVRASQEKDGGIANKAHCAIFNVSKFHSKALFEYPGVAEALQHGLNAEYGRIVSNCTFTLSNITFKYPDNDILATHPDLVTAVVNTFRNKGVCYMFECKLVYLPRHISASITNPPPLSFTRRMPNFVPTAKLR
jgi:hypothetical protein